MNEACALSQRYVEDGETPAPRGSRGENPAYSAQVLSLIAVNHQQKSICVDYLLQPYAISSMLRPECKSRPLVNGNHSFLITWIKKTGFRCRVSGFRREERKSGNPKPHMKLHHLLQKCSFFLIKLAASMAWIKQRTAEYRMSKDK
jgi:hypothetical protein